MCDSPYQRGETVFEASRKSVKRSEAVVDEDDNRVDLGGNVAADIVAHAKRAEHPAPAVEFQHEWSICRLAASFVGTNRQLAGGSCNPDVGDLDASNDRTERAGFRHDVVAYCPPLHPYEILVTFPRQRRSPEDRAQSADTSIQRRHFAKAPVPRFMSQAPSQDYVLRQ